jgi:hypothetical protein
MRKRRFVTALAFLVAAILIGCRISEKEIETEINRRGGELVRAPAERPQDIGHGIGVSTGLGNSGIRVTYTPPAGAATCGEYCWVQVVRKYLDRDVVKKPSLLDPGNPIFIREDAHITDSGYVVDSTNSSACDSIYKGNLFIDDPGFPIANFDNNKMNSSAGLFVAEFETCVKCSNPKGPWLACFKWYYVRIYTTKGAATYVVKGSSSDKPTPEFVEAFNKW